jgi:hypothetical protein
MGNGIWRYQSVHVADDRVLALFYENQTMVQSIVAFTSSGTLSDTIISRRNITDFNSCKGLLAVVLYPDTPASEDTISLFSIDRNF